MAHLHLRARPLVFLIYCSARQSTDFAVGLLLLLSPLSCFSQRWVYTHAHTPAAYLSCARAHAHTHTHTYVPPQAKGGQTQEEREKSKEGYCHSVSRRRRKGKSSRFIESTMQTVYEVRTERNKKNSEDREEKRQRSNAKTKKGGESTGKRTGKSFNRDARTRSKRERGRWQASPA